MTTQRKAEKRTLLPWKPSERQGQKSVCTLTGNPSLQQRALDPSDHEATDEADWRHPHQVALRDQRDDRQVD